MIYDLGPRYGEHTRICMEQIVASVAGDKGLILVDVPTNGKKSELVKKYVFRSFFIVPH